MRIALAGGMVAGAVAMATPGAQATPTNVGGCSGLRALGGAKSTYVDPADGKPAGITANLPTAGANHDAKVALKGIGTPSTNAVQGTCNFTAPGTPGGAGTFTVSKWSIATASPATDCISDTDTAEWPLNGAAKYALSDASSIATYQTVNGFEPNPTPGGATDILNSTGIITKGHGVGAMIAAQVYFNPVIKDKTQTTEAPYPGYSYDLGAALGCTGAFPTADIRGLLIGDGTSPLTGLTANGLNFTVGQ